MHPMRNIDVLFYTSAILLFTACAIPLTRTMEELSLPEFLTCASGETFIEKIFTPGWTDSWMTAFRVCLEFSKPVASCGEQRPNASFVVNVMSVRSTPFLQYPPIHYTESDFVNKNLQMCHTYDVHGIAEGISRMRWDPTDVRVYVVGKVSPARGEDNSTTTLKISIRSLSYFVAQAEEFPVVNKDHKLHQVFCPMPNCLISADNEEGVQKTVSRFAIKTYEAPFCIKGDGPLTSGMFKIFSFDCLKPPCPTKFYATIGPPATIATTENIHSTNDGSEYGFELLSAKVPLDCTNVEVYTKSLPAFHPQLNHSFVPSVQTCLTISDPVVSCNYRGYTSFSTFLTSPDSSTDTRIVESDRSIVTRQSAFVPNQWCWTFNACQIANRIAQFSWNPSVMGLYTKGYIGKVKGRDSTKQITTTAQLSMRSLSYFVHEPKELRAVTDGHTVHEIFCTFRGCEVDADVTKNVEKTVYRFRARGFNQAPLCEQGDGPLTGNMFKMFSFECLEPPCPTKFYATIGVTRTQVTFFTIKNFVVTCNVFFLLTLACLIVIAARATSAI